MPISKAEQRVGIFFDTQNLYHSAKLLHGSRVHFANILEDAVGDRKLIRAMAYLVRTKTDEEKPFVEALMKLGIEIREKELIEFASGAKKADWDVGLVIDVVRMLDLLDVVVIASGDGDFKDLGDYVKGRGRIFEVMAFGETTSSRLVECADIYTDLSSDRKRYLMHVGGARRS